MMEGARWCPHCMLQGERKRLGLFQISDNFAAHLCENEKCVNIAEVSSVSTLILQRKSSEIPNTKRKKTRQDPAVDLASKQTHRSSRSHDILASSQDSISALDNKTQHLILAKVSSRTLPQVNLWRNKSALCWLDACMCVLVSCGRLRECLAKLPGESSIRTLCTVFMKAQSSLKMALCPDAKVREQSPSGGPVIDISHLEEDCILPTLNHAAVPCDGLPAGRNLSPVNSGIPEREELSPNVGTTCDNPAMQQVPTRTSGGTGTNLSDSTGMETSEPLDNIRNALFQQLQPLLKCEMGQESSPLLALPLLLRLDRRLEEHFTSRYRLEFCCNACQYTQVDVNKKMVPTVMRVPADFSMSSPVSLQKCPQCSSQDQINQLVFHSLPACVMMHFQEGLPVSDLSRHHTFTIRGEMYTLSSVIQYCRNPNHFVTYIRDCEANYWLKFDDLLPSPFVWQHHPPSIPANEIHIMVWERVTVPCTACVGINDDITRAHSSPVRTAAPCGQQPKTNRGSQPNGIVHFNQGELAWLASSARSSLDGRSAGGNPVQADVPVVDRLAVTCIDLTRESEASEEGTTLLRKLEEQSTGFIAKSGPQCSKPRTLSSPVSRIAACSLTDDHTNQISSKQHHMATKTSEPVHQSRRPETNHKNNSTNVHVSQSQKNYEEPTFLKKLHARRKNKESLAEEKRVVSILEKIPAQLLNYNMYKAPSSKNGMPSMEMGTATDLARRSPRQSQPNQQKLLALHNSSKESRDKIVRSALTGTQTKASVKQVKFQPYGYSSELQMATCRTSDQSNAEGNHGTHSTLSSWKKRVGMYTSSTRNPRKRARQDSTDNGNPNLPVHHGPPCSSVSSPSACSDISSVSDNQAFVSGNDDLAAAIDELCKVLDVGSQCTPSVSSRLSSPSEDMFLSELLDAEAPTSGMEGKNVNTVTFSDGAGQVLSTYGYDDALVTLTASSTERVSTHLLPPLQLPPVSSSHRVSAGVTPLNDFDIGGVDAISFTNSLEGKDLVTFTIPESNDAAHPMLCDDIQDVLDSEWNDHFVEMLSM